VGNRTFLFEVLRQASGNQTYGRILKANLSWSPTWAIFCQLIASISDVLPQLNLTKLKLEYLKFGFLCKNERYKQGQNFFCVTQVRLFSSSAEIVLECSR